ncbi:MAG: ABC-F family ATP-binding cassette domain-containing protein [Chlorobiales bacterium]|jgi:ABC transport system ATP-binding/permease protein|nr:ABC-F family ATP-binding cassette domain-containing protein [Chlorobiales bacterium]
MNILSFEDVSKLVGEKILFDHVSFGMDDADKFGVIGENGSGKSTLLKMIAGIEPPDSGRVIIPGNKTIMYLPQNPPFNPDQTVLEAVLHSQSGMMKLILDYELACHELQANHASDPALVDKVSRLANELQASGAWELETNAHIVLDKLGITDTDAKIGTLSGGQRKRVALAHALVVPSDMLILDEPTNHLDADSVDWLESYVQRYNGAVLLVTHDRYFLDRVANRILEIERGGIKTFTGNYASYLEKKEEMEAQDARIEQKRAGLLRQELAWLKRGAKARSTKQKARVDRAHELMDAPKKADKAELDIAFASARLGTKIVDFYNVSKSYDSNVLLKDFSYNMSKGERIGIIGPNGSGKTSLLEMITGRTEPTEGRLEIGETVVLGYYDQESRELNEQQRVIDYIREEAEHIKMTDGSLISASKMLERFLFTPASQYNMIGKLSGGERKRLYLLRILMRTPNVLILDEPTNDLDIPTLQRLEEYLDSFAGCLIVVSHDRYFLDRTIDHVFRFEGEGKLREYPGNYSMFLEIKAREESGETTRTDKKEKPTAVIPEKPVARPKKLSFKEQRELEELEKKIAKAEARQAVISEELSKSTLGYDQIQPLSTELSRLAAELETMLERWAELAELV